MMENGGGQTGTPTDASKLALRSPEIGRVLDNLSNRHRRLILLLLKHEDNKKQDDLLFRSEGDARAAELELIHNHLPKLEEAGYIEWDRETGEISKGPRFDEIEPVLELIENHSDELPAGWP